LWKYAARRAMSSVSGVSCAGDENNRQMAALASEQGGQFKAACSGHPHVGDHARIFVGQIGVHEFLHRLEGPRLHLRRPHDACVCGADRRFVIHDIDLDREIRHRLVSSMLQTWCIAAIEPKSYAPHLQYIGLSLLNKSAITSPSNTHATMLGELAAAPAHELTSR
jgi:hypothetical protein